MSCWSPITLKNQSSSAVRTGKHMTVPCGKCLGCLQRKRSDWTLRMEYEESICKSSAFVTFTYDEEHVPLTKNGNLTLDKNHLQDYFKRMRVPGMKYFAVGEYGEHTGRPHYHAAIFNLDKEIAYQKWSIFRGFNIHNEPIYEKLGNVLFGKVETASIHYLTKYMINEYETKLDELKPFRLMSKGLGKGYEDIIRNYCNSHKSNIITRPGGDKSVLPRYWNEKIFSAACRQEMAEKAFQERDLQKEVDRFELTIRNRKYQKRLANKTSKSNKC